MAQFGEIYKKKIATLLNAYYVAKHAREDNMPCRIEPCGFLEQHFDSGLIASSATAVRIGTSDLDVWLLSASFKHLFLGSVGAAHNKDALKGLNITHILIVAETLVPAYPNDFKYKKIKVPDKPEINIAEYFDECFSFINEAEKLGGRVLVHCFAGKSRSVTVVAAYLMKHRGMSLSEALELMRSKRPQIAPNHGFMSQLQNFENLLKQGG